VSGDTLGGGAYKAG